MKKKIADAAKAFVDWMTKSFVDHPVYTIIFGVACFLFGLIF